jgi:hypothetical protein
MRTTTAHSHRQVGATGRAGIFVAVSRAFLLFGLPERTPEGRGWPGLAGWMKAQIRAKMRIQGCDWADLRRPDEKKWVSGPRRACEWRCSKVAEGHNIGHASWANGWAQVSLVFLRY